MSYRYRSYYIHIMANLARTLHIGVTSDLERRVAQHKQGSAPGFTRRYGLHMLVYWEEFPYVYDALSREKQIKGWLREKKVALIEALNPTWADLSVEW